MAIFTIGKDRYGKTKLYKKRSDLLNLIRYCHSKCAYFRCDNLFEFDMDTIINQIFYLQDCKGTVLNTRAVHYIISFLDFEFHDENKVAEAERFVEWFNGFYFKDYQHMCFLHTDKPGRFDVHCIINPVNIKDLKMYHCSPQQLEALIQEIAYDLFYLHKITIYGHSYIDEKGAMRYGDIYEI